MWDWVEALSRNPRANGLAVLGSLLTLLLLILLALLLLIVSGTAVAIGLAVGLPFWIILAVGIPTVASVLAIFLLGAIYASTRRPYRDVLKKVTRDYIVVRQDLDYFEDPEHASPAGQSEGVRDGRDSADVDKGDEIYRKYGLPPEDEYR